jgi:hypothetical protein
MKPIEKQEENWKDTGVLQNKGDVGSNCPVGNRNSVFNPPTPPHHFPEIYSD